MISNRLEMKINKIIYSPIVPVVIAGVLFIVGLQYKDLTSQEFNKGNAINNFLSIKIDCSKGVPKNPYPERTSKYTGFEWSRLDRGSRDCEAWNQPFIDGCMEYVRQEKSYNDCLYDQSGINIETKLANPVLLGTCSDRLAGYCLDGLGVSSLQNTAVIQAPTQAVNKKNPSFNDVILSSCGNGYANPYKGTQVQWNAQISEYAHTGGIRFRVIDDEHPQAEGEKHGHFWGVFLGSADDPRYGAGDDYDQEGLRKWGEEWSSSWVTHILDVYGGISDIDWHSETIFKVTAMIDYVDCDPYFDGGYIETSVVKIEKKAP